MYDIDEIMSMLDWNNDELTQKKGIELAKNIKTINAFIQPMHPGCNKNVGENCAIILVEKSDDILKPYLSHLLKWIEDLNWPGALIILERLKKFSEIKILSYIYGKTVMLASKTNNKIWLTSLSELLDNEKLKMGLSKDVLEILQDYNTDDATRL